MEGWNDRRKDGMTLFSRILPATAGGPIKQPLLEPFKSSHLIKHLHKMTTKQNLVVLGRFLVIIATANVLYTITNFWRKDLQFRVFWCHSCIPIHFWNFDPQEKIVFIVFTIFVVHEILKIFLQSINQ